MHLNLVAKASRWTFQDTVKRVMHRLGRCRISDPVSCDAAQDRWKLRAERLPAWVCVMGLVLRWCNDRTGSTMTVCRACASIHADPERWYCGDDGDANGRWVDGPVAMID